MKITFISDTHGLHDQLHLGEGDMLIHCGDVSNVGTRKGIIDFLDWFKSQKYEYKIFIAGNHDYYFERASILDVESLIPEGVIYLNDSGVNIEGIHIWGSPIQPWFFDWAFNRKRGQEIQKHWDLIPENTDILITHGPPHGILDATTKGELVGCVDLLSTLKAIKPRIHAFGHIHEGYGMKKLDGIEFVNASVLNVKYELVNKPVELEYK